MAGSFGYELGHYDVSKRPSRTASFCRPSRLPSPTPRLLAALDSRAGARSTGLRGSRRDTRIELIADAILPANPARDRRFSLQLLKKSAISLLRSADPSDTVVWIMTAGQAFSVTRHHGSACLCRSNDRRWSIRSPRLMGVRVRAIQSRSNACVRSHLHGEGTDAVTAMKNRLRRGFTLIDRAPGGDRDYRRAHRVAASRRAKRPRGRPPRPVRQQPGSSWAWPSTTTSRRTTFSRRAGSTDRGPESRRAISRRSSPACRTRPGSA